MTKPVQIRNENVARDIRELAEITRESVTQAVAVAVRERLHKERARRRRDIEEKLRRIQEIVQRVKDRPKLGPVPTDADFYDENGFPR